jgi:hypothetical protein
VHLVEFLLLWPLALVLLVLLAEELPLPPSQYVFLFP